MQDLTPMLAVAAGQHSCLTYSQATEWINSSTLVRLCQRGVLEHVAPSVYKVRGATSSPHCDAMIALLTTPGAALSHRSAARLWGLKRVAEPKKVELTVPRSKNVRSAHAIVHSSSQLKGWTTTFSGVPVTTPARTIVDLSRYYSLPYLEKIIDEACAKQLLVNDEVAFCLANMKTRGRSSITKVRLAMQERNITDQTLESDMERETLDWLRDARLPKPKGQMWVTAFGNNFRLDFAYPDVKIAIEVDEDHHRLPTIANYDRLRDADLALEGWHIIHRTSDTTCADLISEVTHALHSLPLKRAS